MIPGSEEVGNGTTAKTKKLKTGSNLLVTKIEWRGEEWARKKERKQRVKGKNNFAKKLSFFKTVFFL